MSDRDYYFSTSLDDIYDMTKTSTIAFDSIRRPIYNMSLIRLEIKAVYYNGTHTTVEWSDGSKTTVNAYSEDEFNKEVGLAMCIARKYFENGGKCETPRAEFLKTVKNAKVTKPKDQK